MKSCPAILRCECLDANPAKKRAKADHQENGSEDVEDIEQQMSHAGNDTEPGGEIQMDARGRLRACGGPISLVWRAGVVYDSRVYGG